MKTPSGVGTVIISHGIMKSTISASSVYMNRGDKIEDIIEELKDRLDKIEKGIEVDKKIRDENGFVNDLYEQYKISLKLAKNDEDLEKENI